MVSVQNFRMDFNGKNVIEDLSFDVRAGETFGLLGSNGSGKTTTIRALLGIYQPTGGTLHVDGKPFHPDNGVQLGYLPEERGLYKKEKVLDVMSYFGRLKGLSRNAARRWSQDYLERVDLASKANTQLDKLSGGQQQKVQLGVTIMNEPSLLILDEPTKGFDPVNRRLLMDIIEERKANGATIMMVTHQMDEVQRLCDRILLLKDGAACAYGTVPEVQRQHGERYIELTFRGALPQLPGHRIEQRGPGAARMKIDDAADPSLLLKDLLNTGATIDSFVVQRTSLDDIFLKIYGSPAGNATTATPADATPADAAPVTGNATVGAAVGITKPDTNLANRRGAHEQEEA